MAALVPARFDTLLAWALAGLEREGSVFGLPRRSFWTGGAGLDLSVMLPDGRADTPLGPAAGPHTQLAQNIVAAWLAGSRVIELKTVQKLDRIVVPRPCIDAPAEGYNVEWSQELELDESLDQYVAAWVLVHALAARGVAGETAASEAHAGWGLAGTHFHASVGYDLAGIRSAGVALFLDGLADCSARVRAWRDRLPAVLRAAADVAVPARVAGTVTLSTFHGCPADEIERIVEHLLDRHGLNVVIKLNPTLLGRDAIAELLHERLGYRDLELVDDAFTQDLPWEQAVGMVLRLSGSARRRGLVVGVKLTNTLVVRNHRRRLPGDVVYLSGPPLHPIAVMLAHRFADATVGRVPMSFSAGVCAENFADTVACGLAPVTTCTDLLRPTGYRRLPRYLKALEAELLRTGTRTIEAYRRSRGGDAVLGVYAARVADDPRYHAPAAPLPPVARPPLHTIDCDACNQCTLACPNGAIFTLAAAPRRVATADLVIEGDRIVEHPAVFETRCDTQWLVFSDFCNACGNCDTFCPEDGGPHRVKPRLHVAPATFAAAAPEDGVLIDEHGDRVTARIGGREHRLIRHGDGWMFGDGVIEATLDRRLEPLAARTLAPEDGHVLPLARAHALRLWVEGALASTNPVSAAIAAGPRAS